MPLRPFSRDQSWLLPPSVEDWLPVDHPARFIAALVEALDGAALAALGIAVTGADAGAPAYHPRLLLGVWLYGFMDGVRASRQLERACGERVPYLWLSGCQYPDHNTLWRFYRDHRQGMRQLFKRTVRTAVQVGLVDLALQAVDGTKVAGNAAKDRTFDAAGLQRLLARTEQAIAELEAQNGTTSEPLLPGLPAALQQQQALRAQVQQALVQVTGAEAADAGAGTTGAPSAGPTRSRINLTDPEAGLVKGRQGVVAGYNAQVVVSPLDPAVAPVPGRFITAADVVSDPDDHAQLLPMLDQARQTTEQAAALTLADGGYHSGPNLAGCAERRQVIVMPEAQDQARQQPYHKDAFAYDPASDTYTCPAGQPLRFAGTKHRTDRPVMRVYRASGARCRGCPAYGTCTTDGRQGRALEIGPYEPQLRAHRTFMATEAAQTAARQRKTLPEPVFGWLKEHHRVRRFLLRGLTHVRAEWTLVTTALNLRTLARVWQRWTPVQRARLVATFAA